MDVRTRRIDSDEEPAAALANAGRVIYAHTRPFVPLSLDAPSGVPSRESELLDELCERLRSRHRSMTILPPCVPVVVAFRVGKKSFAVSRMLLEKDPGSLLFVLAADHFTSHATAAAALGESAVPSTTRKRKRGTEEGEEAVPADAVAAAAGPITIPSRNPQLFAMLLNLLRGYRNAVPPDWVDSCRDEAIYYGLATSWNARFQVSPTAYFFRSPLHNSKLVSDAVLGIASDFFAAGEHHIDFSVAQSDRVAVGVMSTGGGASEELEAPVQDGHNGAFYWNDGKLSLCLGESRVVETGFPFPAGAIVRVVFDADARIIRWVVNGEYCVAMERLPAGRRYAFASIASRSSLVTIVPT